MKIKDLMEKLSKFDPEMEVVVGTDWCAANTTEFAVYEGEHINWKSERFQAVHLM